MTERPHGTRAKYVVEKCRCNDCRAANTAAARVRAKHAAQQAHGAVPANWVDADPVRAHVRSLMACGVGWRRIAAVAGVPNGSMSKLLYGAGPRQPSGRVLARTADKLLAVTADQIADGALVDATGTRRRLQALVAVGHSHMALSRELEVELSHLWALVNSDQARIVAGTARAVRALYDRLWDVAPDARSPAKRGAVTRARKIAEDRGWAPPMAWDDDTIDDPAATPTERWDGTSRMDLAEVEHLEAGGCSIDEIARRMGVTPGAIERARFRGKKQADQPSLPDGVHPDVSTIVDDQAAGHAVRRVRAAC